MQLEVTVSGKIGKYLIIGLEDMKRNKLNPDLDNKVLLSSEEVKPPGKDEREVLTVVIPEFFKGSDFCLNFAREI